MGQVKKEEGRRKRKAADKSLVKKADFIDR